MGTTNLIGKTVSKCIHITLRFLHYLLCITLHGVLHLYAPIYIYMHIQIELLCIILHAVLHLYAFIHIYMHIQIDNLDREKVWARSLEGQEYMPGLVGLNNMKNNDYVNVAVQILARVVPIRNYFLDASNYSSSKSILVKRFGELLRKIWNPRNFKGQVCTSHNTNNGENEYTVNNGHDNDFIVDKVGHDMV